VFKKLWLLAAFAVLMSLSTGMAFGHWTSFANINGTVESGTLCIEMTPPLFQLDNGNDWTVPPGDNATLSHQLDKNVANCSMKLSSDYKTLWITINNAYPCYYDAFHFYLYNCGTIPEFVTNVTLVPLNNTAGTIVIFNIGHQYQKLDLNGDGKYDVEMRWGGGIGQILDPYVSADTSFDIHFLEDCPQGTTLVLQIQLYVSQIDPSLTSEWVNQK